MKKHGALRDLSDDLLMETYEKARELNLSNDFLCLITDEMNRRSIYNKKIDL
ncbi:sporulation histidine kinase inhibitor Sda [Salipaludibacillus sp. HK11]|uniref:sporulation histidine kinase inhibitor Sda n=1 Tax=Salipaludibacillus sp. HK11 TaxID=3394320 RepID=UPI0039FDB9B2